MFPSLSIFPAALKLALANRKTTLIGSIGTFFLFNFLLRLAAPGNCVANAPHPAAAVPAEMAASPVAPPPVVVDKYMHVVSERELIEQDVGGGGGGDPEEWCREEDAVRVYDCITLLLSLAIDYLGRFFAAAEPLL